VGVRLTNEDDGKILPCGYSYWAGINAHLGESGLLVVLGVVGRGPSLWHVDKGTLEVTRLGPLFPADHLLSRETAERWYWSLTDPHVLYACDLLHLYRVDVRSRRPEAVIDLGPIPAIPARTDEILWQLHSSADGRVHSATVKAGESRNWKPLGCIVYREGADDPWRWFPAVGAFDEAQIDKSGGWLLIKEDVDGQDGEDNRIISLADGRERVLTDRQGAAGHSDNGFGYMVAADNWHEKPNAIRLWMFDETRKPQGRVVYHSPTWDVEVTHVSHCNARPGAPDGQFVIGSGATRASGPRANEIVAFPLDGSLRVLVIAPTMVDLDAPGGGDGDYGKLPKAGVDATGSTCCGQAITGLSPRRVPRPGALACRHSHCGWTGANLGARDPRPRAPRRPSTSWRGARGGKWGGRTGGSATHGGWSIMPDRRRRRCWRSCQFDHGGRWLVGPPPPARRYLYEEQPAPSPSRRYSLCTSLRTCCQRSRAMAGDVLP
jgi:hypothetical protein